MSDNDEQYRFGKNGNLEPADEGHNEDGLNDFGEPLGKFGTKAGFDMWIMGSVLQKAIRRDDEERAAWAAWELVRSGYYWWYWKRLKMIAVEEAVSEDRTIELVRELYEWITDSEYEIDSWEGIITAIRAAIACARMPKSREYAGADAWFQAIANEQAAAAEENREPELKWPEIPDEAYDKHTQGGKAQGRGFKHFMVHSSRLSGNTEVGREWHRKALEHAETAWPEFKDIHDITNEEIELALTDVEPGEHDDPERVNKTLDEIK